MLNAAVVGLGVGEQHARYYHGHSECNLHSICDLDFEKANIVAKQYDNVETSHNWKDLCNNPDIDIVSLASFDHHHAEQVIIALKLGKHLFVEKPLCLTHRELKDIVTIWEKTNLKIISNLPLRTAPLFKWLKAEIEKGMLGEIYAVDGEYLYGRVKKITHGWRKDIIDYSVIEGGGIHMIDLIMYLTSQCPTKVSSIGNKIATKNTEFLYDDYTSSTFQFESNMIARLTSNFGCVHPHQHILKIFGTKATFILDDLGPRIQKNYDRLNSDDYEKVKNRQKDKPYAEKINLSATPSSKVKLIDSLVDAINNKNNKKLTLHEFSLMNVCLTAVEALKSGKIEEIGEI